VVLTQSASMWYDLIRLNATRYGAYRVSRRGNDAAKPIPADRAAATARSVCVPPNPKAGQCPAFLFYRSPLDKISPTENMSLWSTESLAPPYALSNSQGSFANQKRPAGAVRAKRCRVSAEDEAGAAEARLPLPLAKKWNPTNRPGGSRAASTGDG
jgi:hypothetical protein